MQEELIIIEGKSKELVNQDTLHAHKEIVKSFRSKFNAKRTWLDKAADWITEKLGTTTFFFVNLLWYVIWMLLNSDFFPGPKFDPYPYSFLTMIVSLEAIFLSIIVLISQNRQSEVADMREEIAFQINVRAEQEITKILNMVDRIHDEMGLNNDSDLELAEMKKYTNLDQIEEAIEIEYVKKKRQ